MENNSSDSLDRPSVGFPLGLGLLLMLLLFMSGFFTCCLHWKKIRSFIQSSRDYDDYNSDIEADFTHSPHKPTPSYLKAKQIQGQSLTVLMPGDQVPKFIAMSCPCKKPHLVEKITIKVQKPPRFPVPLY